MSSLRTPPPGFRGKRPRQPKLRLVCFPYAGGGASLYRQWQAAMPQGVQVCAVQLPGRKTAFAQTPLARLDEVIPALGRAMEPYCDTPFRLFLGTALGAKIAFELARTLRGTKAWSRATCWCRSPGAAYSRNPRPLHQLSDQAFIDGLRRYSAMPEEVLQNRDPHAAVPAVLRADFSIDETLCLFRRNAPLACPITAFGGSEDHEADRQELLAWDDYTHGLVCLPHLSRDPLLHQDRRKSPSWMPWSNHSPGGQSPRHDDHLPYDPPLGQGPALETGPGAPFHGAGDQAQALLPALHSCLSDGGMPQGRCLSFPGRS